MHSVPSFEELSHSIAANWKDGLKVLPPRNPGRNGILTGSIMYARPDADGKSYLDQIAFAGPPCTIIPPIREGRVMYPKLTLNLNRKDGKADENDPRDGAYTEERKLFVAMVHDMQGKVLAKIRENPKAYFLKAIEPENVIIKDSLVEPEEDNYRTKMTCKVDLKQEAKGAREDIDWTHINVDVHDVKIDAQGQVELQKTTLEDVNGRDRLLPIFRSAYPYFEVVKNHRTGLFEGHCKIQWCLSGLQRIERINDNKRKREDDGGDEADPSWMAKIKEYMAAQAGGDEAQANSNE
jgi:hypothetical protein